MIKPNGITGNVKTIFTTICATIAVAAFAEGQSFDRYQTIIDRKPFGPEPVNFDPEAEPGSASAAAAGAAENGEMTPEQRTAEEQQLAASVRVSILNVTPSGAVAVGFTDVSAKPEEIYYLTVGRSQNGWTVKSADPATEAVTLEHEGIEVTVKLGENAGGKGDKGGRGGGMKRMGMRQDGGFAGRGMGMQPGGGDGMRPLGGLARLRQQRMELEEREREEAARKREADAVAKAEREEREAREAEEKAREAQERAQTREALLQMSELLKKQREEGDAAKREKEGEQGEDNDTE